MKTLFSILILATCTLTACNTTGPQSAATVAGATQQVATTIRQAENWFPSPTTFNLFYDSVAAINPGMAATAAQVKAEYALLYAGGKLTQPALESLATSYDAKPASAVVGYINRWETTPEGRAKLGSDAGKRYNY